MEESNGVSEAHDGNVSIGRSSTFVLPNNPKRRFAIFVNDSNEAIYLSFGDSAVINQGIRLNAYGGSLEINSTNLYTGQFSAICASGGKNLTVVEG